MNTTQKLGPKDVFLHLFAMVALYTSAVSFLVLVFQYINLAIPDALEDYYVRLDALASIRWAVATFIVAFPAYFLITRFLHKAYASLPERRELRVRKWLIYFTLFVTAIVIGGDVITLVYKLLEGEFTTRFLLKVCAVLFTSGSIFFYYLMEVKDAGERARYDSAIKYFSWAIAVVGIVAIIAAFFAAGSPKERRLQKFDAQRVQDLQILQTNIVEYWRSKDVLPAKLADVRDDLRGMQVPVDPETGSEYEYFAGGDLNFKLCATFNLESFQGIGKPARDSYAYPVAPGYYGGVNDTWDHAEGRVCFERTIDPDFYPDPKLAPPIY